MCDVGVLHNKEKVCVCVCVCVRCWCVKRESVRVFCKILSECVSLRVLTEKKKERERESIIKNRFCIMRRVFCRSFSKKT